MAPRTTAVTTMPARRTWQPRSAGRPAAHLAAARSCRPGAPKRRDAHSANDVTETRARKDPTVAEGRPQTGIYRMNRAPPPCPSRFLSPARRRFQHFTARTSTSAPMTSAWFCPSAPLQVGVADQVARTGHPPRSPDHHQSLSRTHPCVDHGARRIRPPTQALKVDTEW